MTQATTARLRCFQPSLVQMPFEVTKVDTPLVLPLHLRRCSARVISWRTSSGSGGTEYSLLSDHTKVPQDVVAGPDLVT